MSHGITSKDQMFSGNHITPWHKLGNVVEGLLTAGDAIEAAGLGWEVELLPVFAKETRSPWFVGDGGSRHIMHEIEDSFATFRKDTGDVLGVVGNKYTPVQNAELFDFLDTLVDSGEAHYETAGSLGGGRRVWMLLKPNENEITLNGEPMLKYLLATSSHDGSSAVRVKPVVVRVVCANTLEWALGENSAEFKARHTASVKGKVQQAREALNIGFKYFEEFERTAKILGETEVEIAQFRELLDELLPINGDDVSDQARSLRMNKRSGIARKYRGLDDEVRNTAWGAVQAINTWELWGTEARADAEKQAARVFSNSSAPLTQQAVKLLLPAQ